MKLCEITVLDWIFVKGLKIYYRTQLYYFIILTFNITLYFFMMEQKEQDKNWITEDKDKQRGARNNLYLL